MASTSKYEALGASTSSLVMRRGINTLTPNVPYLITDVGGIEEKEYGQTVRLTLRDSNKKAFFVVLTNRMVTKVGKQFFDDAAADVKAKRPPFFIFKGMEGKAYDVEMKAFGQYIGNFNVVGVWTVFIYLLVVTDIEIAGIATN